MWCRWLHGECYAIEKIEEEIEGKRPGKKSTNKAVRGRNVLFCWHRLIKRLSPVDRQELVKTDDASSRIYEGAILGFFFLWGQVLSVSRTVS